MKLIEEKMLEKLEEGNKADIGKLPWALLPFDAVKQVVEVLHFGCRKYGDRNWEKGIKYDRCYSAALRHLTAWWEGEKVDQESNIHHLAHASCCVLFLLAYEIRGKKEYDNRPNNMGM